MLDFGGGSRKFDPDVHLTQQVEALRDLHARPDGENDAIVRMLTPQTNDLSPPFLFELARRLWDRDRDAALEWFSVAVIRGQYDAQRCRDRTAGQGLDSIYSIADNVREGIQRDQVAYGRAGLRALTRTDLFAGTASPQWICAHGIQSYRTALENRSQSTEEWRLPESEWQAIRDRVRMTAVRIYSGLTRSAP